MSRKEKILLISLVSVAFLIRAILARYEIYHPDSGLYLLLARAIMNGHLHIEIGSEIGLYQPMYSIATAVFSSVIRNMEIAGTLVSVISGSFLVMVIYL